MAERQIGHRKSCLVLPSAFPSSTDVPVLLLNQPNILHARTSCLSLVKIPKLSINAPGEIQAWHYPTLEELSTPNLMDSHLEPSSMKDEKKYSEGSHLVWYPIGVDFPPYVNYNGMYRCEGKGFLAVIVWHRVWKRSKFWSGMSFMGNLPLV